MENRKWAAGPIEYRKWSDKQLDKEQAYILSQISATMQRVQNISVLLCQGKRDILSGTRCIQDLQEHYRALEAVTEEMRFRQIP